MEKQFSLSEIIRFELDYPGLEMAASRKGGKEEQATRVGPGDIPLDNLALWKTVQQFDLMESERANCDQGI